MHLPDNCTLTLVGASNKSDTAFPAFTASYPSDDAVQLLDHLEVIQISMIEFDEDLFSAIVRLKYICHVSCKCWKPVLSDIQVVTSIKSAKNFMKELDKTQCYFWILSMPSFEIRILINHKTSGIVDKSVIQRVIH